MRTKKKCLLWIICMLMLLLPLQSLSAKASENELPYETTLIEAIEMSITAPEEGKNPAYESKMDAHTMRSLGYGYEVCDWQENGRIITPNDTFKKGKTYTALIYVEAHPLYRLNIGQDAQEGFLDNSNVNGIRPVIDSFSEAGTSMVLSVTFTLDAPLYSVDITVTEPVDGMKLGDIKTTVNQGACTAEVITWMKRDGQNYAGIVMDDEKFVGGKTYTAFVGIYPTEGFAVDVSESGLAAFMKASRVNGISPYMHGPFSGYSEGGKEVYVQIELTAKNVENTEENTEENTADKILKDEKTKASYRIEKSKSGAKTAVFLKPKNKKIKTITIPDKVKLKGITYKVTGVADQAFKDCKKLTNAVIGKNVTSIGKAAFYNCTKLKSVKLGKNVTSIGEKAFYKCTALTKITIPGKVEKIGKQAFYGCKKLKSVVLQTSRLNEKKIGAKAFSGIHAKATIKVPSKKMKSYTKILKKKGLGKAVKFKK